MSCGYIFNYTSVRLERIFNPKVTDVLVCEIQICSCYSREYFLFKVVGIVPDKGFTGTCIIEKNSSYMYLLLFNSMNFEKGEKYFILQVSDLLAKTFPYMIVISRITLKI